MNLFEKFNLSEKLFRTIEKMGFTSPTEIQEKSISPIIAWKDLVGESATG